MLDRLKRIRIIMIAGMVVIGILINHITMIQNGLWIVIVIFLINAQLTGGLIAFQAKQVLWGALAGVIFAIPIWGVLHFNYNLLFIFALLFLALASFLIQKNAKYYQAVVIILLIMLFDYTHPSVFDVKLAAIDRIICVLIAVSMFFIFEYILNALFIHNINIALYEECSKAEEKMAITIDKLLERATDINSANFHLQLHKNYDNLLIIKQDLEKRIGALDSVKEHVDETLELVKNSMLQLQILSSASFNGKIFNNALWHLKQIRSDLDEHQEKSKELRTISTNTTLKDFILA